MFLEGEGQCVKVYLLFREFGVYFIGSLDEKFLNKERGEVEVGGLDGEALYVIQWGRCYIQLKVEKIQLFEIFCVRKDLRQWVKFRIYFVTMVLCIEENGR